MAGDVCLTLDDRGADLRIGLYHTLEAAVFDCVTPQCGEPLVVDVGAGRGELLERLSKRSVNCLGIGPEPECVAAASRHGECLQDDLSRLLAGRSPDVIVCSHVLEHLDAPLAALQKMSQAGARQLVLAVPNVHRTSRLLRVMIGRAGYVVEQWYVDRVTVNPFTGSFATKMTRALRRVEEKAMAWLHPTLASSLIARCRSEE